MQLSAWLRSRAAVVVVCLSAVLAGSAQSTLTVTYAKLEAAAWAPVIGPSISSIASTAYAAVPEPGGIQFYQFGPAYAGVLFKHTCVLPVLPAKGAVTLSFDVQTDDAGVIRAQAREWDVMLVGPKGEVYNGSNQLNEAEGGNWQSVSPAYHWTDIGFNPGPLPANAWVSVSYTLTFDTAGQRSAITSVSVGDKTYAVPSPVWVPAQQLGWAPNIAVVQIQLDENGQAGAYSEKFRNLQLTAGW